MPYKYNPPTGWPPSTTVNELRLEIRRWNEQAGSEIARIDTPTHYPIGKDSDQAASITLHLRGVPVPIRVDRWPTFAINFRCCFLVLRDMRLAEARGVEKAAAAAYAALLPAAKAQRDPWEVLGLRPGATQDEVNAMHRIKSRAVVGDEDAMLELNLARDRLLAEVRNA